MRNKALSIYAAVGASGWSLGLVFGGALTELGWRYTFFMPVPIALAILLLLPRYLDKDEPVAVNRRLRLQRHGDPRGGDAGACLHHRRGSDVGWGAPQTLLSFAGSRCAARRSS